MNIRLLLSFVLASTGLLVVPGCSLERAGIAAGGDGGDDAGLDGQILGRDGGEEDAGMVADGGDAGMPVDDGGQDASVDAGHDAAVDGGCTEPAFCDGDTLYACSGGVLLPTPCALGCSSGSCRAVVPSNVGSEVAFSDGTAALDVADGELWIVYPDTGRIEVRDGSSPGTILRTVRGEGVGTENGIRYAQASGGGGSYGVFVFASLRVRTTGVLAGNAGSSRALVLISAGDVLIDGYVTVRGSGLGPGPGGAAGGEAESDGAGSGAGRRGVTGSLASGDEGGGGGASYGTDGGDGGDSPSENGGNKGSTYGDSDLEPLRGGSGGGGGGDDDGGRGGHGGGAIQITSATRIVVSTSGAIDAGGEGGRGGLENIDSGAGGGGGSGGAILLEAVVVTLAANRVAATGGAGGQGARGGVDGADGEDGRFDMVPAAGSATDGAAGGGGAGSDADGVAGIGLDATNGGGGGGGAGRIRINNAAGTGAYMVYPTISSGVSSVGAVGRTP